MKTSLKSGILFIFLGLSAAAFSQNTSNTTEITFPVRGMCDMCEARIEKAAGYVKGVKKADWDLEKQTLTVVYRTDKTSREEIEKAIAKIGYDTENCRASEEAYNALHQCCKYRDK